MDIVFPGDYVISGDLEGNIQVFQALGVDYFTGNGLISVASSNPISNSSLVYLTVNRTVIATDVKFYRTTQ